MTRSKLLFSKLSDIEKRRDDWIESRVMNFRPGDVVRSKNNPNSIGVIYYGLTNPETYQVKWHRGPNPWDFIEGVAQGSALEKTDLPNPLKYKWTELVPGPGSEMIAKLQEAFAKQDSTKKKRTAKEVEEYLAAIEEDMKTKKQLVEIDESKVDFIADETMEEEEVVLPINDIEVKRDKIISEE